ncbi:HNH endonuclease signature motif containing protein [Marisediminicola senii]|uniref:HNH endonuclease signature motif containing protein n=1 Tax=Marisediminicola senii TaxID=2711233 RepID=UPI0013ED3AB9|nr:HNH endonuclease signature motif containing protein [Marisediminicola senii]
MQEPHVADPLLAVRLATAALVPVADDIAIAAQGLSDEALIELADSAEETARYNAAISIAAAAEIEERSRRELGNEGLSRRHGHSRGAGLVERVTRVSAAEASRRIRLGTAVSPRTSLGGGSMPPLYPAMADALSAGRLGVDAANAILRALSQVSSTADPVDLHIAEAALVEYARDEPADLVAVQAIAYREALDPDGAEPRDEELRRRRALTLGREVNGMTRGVMMLNPEAAALVRSMLSNGGDPARSPWFISDDDLGAGSTVIPSPDGDIVVKFTDPRSREQRQLDILMGTLKAGLGVIDDAGRSRSGSDGGSDGGSNDSESTGGGRSGGRQRPLATVTAVVSLKDLEAGIGVGWLDDVTEPVSAVTMQTMICDSGYRPMIVGDEGEVLYLGRTRRFFTRAQRTALGARDGGCVWPSCTAPPSWCEAHHIVEYTNGGRTDIDNGALLCSNHHHMLHASAFTMKMIQGRPRLLSPPWLDPQQAWKPLGRNRALMTALRR